MGVNRLTNGKVPVGWGSGFARAWMMDLITHQTGERETGGGRAGEEMRGGRVAYACRRGRGGGGSTRDRSRRGGGSELDRKMNLAVDQ